MFEAIISLIKLGMKGCFILAMALIAIVLAIIIGLFAF